MTRQQPQITEETDKADGLFKFGAEVHGAMMAERVANNAHVQNAALFHAGAEEPQRC